MAGGAGAGLGLLNLGVQAIGIMQQMESAKAEESQFRLQEQALAAQTAQEEAARQEELRRVLSSQSAIFGASGVQSTSGSPLNFALQDISAAGRESAQAQSLLDINRAQLGISQRSARMRRRGALISGISSISSQVASGFARR